MPHEMILENLDLFTSSKINLEKLKQLVVRRAILGDTKIQTDGWKEYTLAEIGTWGSGGTPAKTHPEYYDGDIPWLVIGDLNDGLILKSQNRITELGLQNSSSKLLEIGTVLIAMYGSIGKLGLTGIRCATNQAIAYCNPNPEIVSAEYLMLLLKGIQPDLIGYGQGATQKNISQTILKRHEIKVPSLASQQRIVDSVEEIKSISNSLIQARSANDKLRESVVNSLIFENSIENVKA
jgi:type I restriction enzyme S subunit